jgi:prepilin-type N-terminal cleavage/methylation domain-containing protein
MNWRNNDNNYDNDRSIVIVNSHSPTGFTLIEAVIVVALFAVCSVVLVDLFIGHNRLYKSETAALNITNDARLSLDDIDSYVRQANRTLSSYSTYTAGPQVLILQIQSVNSSNQLVPGTFDDVVFYLTGSNLFRQVFPNAASTRAAVTKKLASSVNSLVFTYNNANYSLVTQVQTDITIQENAGVQTRAITLSTKSKLRSY